MENPYGHDRWCNLMTAHSEHEGGGVDRVGGEVRKDG